ncbi:MAG TPA: phosphopantetheine-binding protein [Polyangium sp.]|nr:phosphopantetheine-binding protein [Polyangium sp.]
MDAVMEVHDPATNQPNPVLVVVAELTKMIAHELDVRIEEKDIDPHIPLLEGGLMLDSMVLFELITLIEKRYGVAFSTENLNTAVFANLTVLAQNITTMRAQMNAESGATA